MAQSRFRVGGAYTRLIWTSNGKAQTLAYVDNIRETAPQPVAAPQAIQPLDSPYPIEIAFPGALQAGTLEVQFREQWNSEVWEAFYQTYVSNLNQGTVIPISDLLGVFQAQLQDGGSISLTKTIIDPTTGKSVREINYSGITIVNVMIDETVNIGTMTFPKSVQFMYLQRTEKFSQPQGTSATGIVAAGLDDSNSLLLKANPYE